MVRQMDREDVRILGYCEECGIEITDDFEEYYCDEKIAVALDPVPATKLTLKNIIVMKMDLIIALANVLWSIMVYISWRYKNGC